ncbi:uncharacterized protein C16orf96 homolog [Pseudophryne corroboree]|uniref:uncharacterized protein C16orf96 homolog n=1 Tax=Pseudophryne corroboree TaxID=495146 RepID=UPI003081FA7D
MSVSFKELVNLAIGSPEPGAVNFNALHSLLHGLLEHLQLGDIQRKLSQEEREFIQPGLVSAHDSAKPPTLFHQLQDRVAQMETRLHHLDSLPSSTSLLHASHAQNKPIEEMWQLMQLKKKVEASEDGVSKVMSAFQELLSTFNSLRQANQLIEDRLGSLSDLVAKMNIQQVERRLQDLEGQTQNIPTLAEKLDKLQSKLYSFPEPSDLVSWPALHDALTDKSSDWALSHDTKQQNVKKVLSGLGTLSGRHGELERRVQGIEEELRRIDLEMGKIGIPEDLLQQLRALHQDVEKLYTNNKKNKTDMDALQGRLHDLTLALQRLDTKTDKLAADLSETATLQSQIDELERKKLNSEELMLELNLKADKRALETKVGQGQLEAAIGEVNAVLEDLIKKLSIQESEWQNMLAKLLAGLEGKLSPSDLESIQRDLEELWRFLKKHLSTTQSYDLDGAAGFRKKLFERVKCISCDRPVTMATAPHLVTVRSAPLIPRNRPNTADYSRIKISGEPQEMTDPEFQYTEPPRPQTSCSYHRKIPSRSHNLTTVFPYGDPGQIQYKNSEVDLMGIDGMLYKGRLDKSFTNHIPDRDPQGLKTPQQPSRARSASSNYRSSINLNTRTPSHLIKTPGSTLNVPSTTELSQPTFHVPSASEPAILLQRPLSSVEQRPD